MAVVQHHNLWLDLRALAELQAGEYAERRRSCELGAGQVEADVLDDDRTGVEGDQVPGAAMHRRHLVHHPRRGARDVVLGATGDDVPRTWDLRVKRSELRDLIAAVAPF